MYQPKLSACGASRELPVTVLLSDLAGTGSVQTVHVRHNTVKDTSELQENCQQEMQSELVLPEEASTSPVKAGVASKLLGSRPRMTSSYSPLCTSASGMA